MASHALKRLPKDLFKLDDNLELDVKFFKIKKEIKRSRKKQKIQSAFLKSLQNYLAYFVAIQQKLYLGRMPSPVLV